MLDKNTWNHLTVSKNFVLKKLLEPKIILNILLLLVT